SCLNKAVMNSRTFTASAKSGFQSVQSAQNLRKSVACWNAKGSFSGHKFRCSGDLWAECDLHSAFKQQLNRHSLRRLTANLPLVVLFLVLKERELDLIVVGWLAPVNFRVALPAYRKQIAW